jgi:signal transduction histidine kinase
MARNDDTASKNGNGALATFSARVGNEINNPLTALFAAQSFLRRKIEGSSLRSDDKVSELLVAIDSGLRAVSKIASDLLDFGTARDVRRSSFLLRELVDEAMTTTRAPKAVTRTNAVADELPPVHLDREKTLRALCHLLQNASDAFAARGHGRIEVSATVGDADVEIAVWDDGDGIAPDILPRIKEPLFSTKPKGTGLGLAIVDALVRAQSGTLEITSAASDGTRFVMKLPTG